jgi:hypothetical protein
LKVFLWKQCSQANVLVARKECISILWHLADTVTLSASVTNSFLLSNDLS